MQAWAFALLVQVLCTVCAHAHWWESNDWFNQRPSGRRRWESHKEHFNDMFGDWGLGGKSKQCHKEKREARAATRDLEDAKAKADQCKTEKRRLESRLQTECGEPRPLPKEITAERRKTEKAKTELQDERVLRVQLEKDHRRLQQKLSSEKEKGEGRERLNAAKLTQAERKAKEMDEQLQEEKQKVLVLRDQVQDLRASKRRAEAHAETANKRMREEKDEIRATHTKEVDASVRKIAELKKGLRKCQQEPGTDDVVRRTSAEDGHSAQSTLMLGVGVALLLIFVHRGHMSNKKAKGLADTQIVELRTKLEESQKQISDLEGELRDELGDMLKMERRPMGRLGSDFDFLVEDQEKENNEMLRFIKIQCSGVQHSDVQIDILDNGCEVKIHRQPSRGVEACEWRERFQFRPSDGRFELREDQIVLERGYLVIVFRAYKTQTRVFRFPPTFDMASYEAEDGVPLTFPNESDSGDTRTEGDRGTAPGRIEMVATAPAAYEAPQAQALTETSGSAINTEDYEATAAVVAAAAASMPRVAAPSSARPTDIDTCVRDIPRADIEELTDPSLTSWIIPPDAPAHTSPADTAAGGDSA